MSGYHETPSRPLECLLGQAIPPPGALGRVPFTQLANAPRPAALGCGYPGIGAQFAMPNETSRVWMEPGPGLNIRWQNAG